MTRGAKAVLDGVDRVLAREHGFTESEVVFVINYDIKYRMSRGTENDDE